MFWKHLKDELKDAETKGWREEAKLVSRNAIIASAAAFCPLGVILAVTVMILYDSVGNLPSLMANTAYFYPVSTLVCIALAVLMHSRDLYTGAMLVALAPFVWIFVFIGSAIYWVVR